MDTSSSEKPTGTDGLPAEMLKNDVCISFLQNFLFIMVEKHDCVFPQFGHIHGTIVPILKSETNDSRIPLNYRWSSLLSIPYMALCTMINNHILEYPVWRTEWIKVQQKLFRAHLCIIKCHGTQKTSQEIRQLLHAL